MKHNTRRIAPALILILAVVLIANFPAYIRSGVGGNYTRIRMPLYAKWTQFLARHYEYERMTKEIVAGCRTEEDKALAILKWTRANLKDMPEGMPVHDDHILYIIIRGYAVPEQFQDVFTTLCVYSGIPAFYKTMYDKSHKTKHVLSFVMLDGKWRVFDAYYGNYLKNAKGDIASIDDIVADPSIVDKCSWCAMMVRGVPYKEYYANMGTVTAPQTFRAKKQMPLGRIIFEIKKALRIEKDAYELQ